MSLNYDLHTHILPAVDDGAKTSDDALNLISVLSEQGVKNICLTPHFYTNKESVSDFLARRKEAADVFLPMIPEDINVKLGAEVFVTKYLFAEEHDLTPLCIEGTRYMLTEFSYVASFSGVSLRMLTRLRDLGIIPILPHVERYPSLMKDTSLLQELISMDVVIQSNTSSFLDNHTKRKLIKMLKNGFIHILSSDTHSMEHNSPLSVSNAQEFIVKKCGSESIDLLNSNAAQIFYS